MEEINLHFTGDMHALTTATNLLSAIIDNHIHQGNELEIDPNRIIWKRALDLNDRALREIEIGLGGPVNGTPRKDGFDITVATEMMAILCLASDLSDLQRRVSNILVAYTKSGEPVTVFDLGAEGAITALLKEAMKPNLVQTLEETPAIVHGGPFANIAHGCNSVVATRMALTLADYVVTEAGFGADLGAQKFLDIKVPVLGKHPDAVVLVATIRSTKMHGGVALDELALGENLEAVREGFKNVRKHIENVQAYGLPVVVALNEFLTDTKDEITLISSGVTNPAVNRWKYRNIGKTRRMGLELEAEQNFGNWSLSESLTLLNTKVLKANEEARLEKGDKVPLVPRVKATLGIKYNFTDKVALVGTYTYFSKRETREIRESQDLNKDDDIIKHTIGGYGVTDLGVLYKADAYSNIKVGSKNIFGKKYNLRETSLEALPAPEKTYYLEMNVRF